MSIGPKSISLVFVLVSGAMLMITSQIVQSLEEQKNHLSRMIAHEKESIRFLETEWAYLNSPAHLENLASDYIKERSEIDKREKPPYILSVEYDIPEPMRPARPVSKPSDSNALSPAFVYTHMRDDAGQTNEIKIREQNHKNQNPKSENAHFEGLIDQLGTRVNPAHEKTERTQ